MTRRAATLAALAMLLVLLSTGRASALDYGVSPAQALIPPDAQRMHDAGLVGWRAELSPSTLSSGYLDSSIAERQALGLDYLPVLFGSPPEGWPAYVANVAASHGSAASAYQVWNEMSLNGLAPDDYAGILHEAAEQIRAEDRGARVVVGGLSNPRAPALSAEEYVRELFALGAAPDFDVIAVHPYAPDVAGVVEQVEAVRRAIQDAGSDKPIWVRAA